MSVKFEVNFESLFDGFVDYIDGDDIEAMTFCLRDDYRDKF